MAALFARLWLSRSVTDPVGLTVAKPFLPAEYARLAVTLTAGVKARRFSQFCAFVIVMRDRGPGL